MYLVVTKTNEKLICKTVDEVKAIEKEISQIYTMSEVDYNDLVSTADIRSCIFDILKGEQMEKEIVLEQAQQKLGIKKSEISKVITAMKREKIIYVVDDFGWLGIN